MQSGRLNYDYARQWLKQVRLRSWIRQIDAIIARCFRQFDLFPEFWQRLKAHFAEAVTGATLSGLIISVVSLLTSLPHWVWLLVLVAAFFFSSYATWREEYLKAKQANEAGSSEEVRALSEHTAALKAHAHQMERQAIDRRMDQSREMFLRLFRGTKDKEPKDDV